jgi:hypothetical protein
MKYIAIAFCLMNWLVIGFESLMGVEQTMASLLSLVIITPFFTAFGLLVAYREGQWSMKK